MEAVTAYHVHQDGSADGCYDIAVADCVLEMIKDGCLSWEQAMKSSASDAARLALLDRASTISGTLRSFVDDTRVAISSWGHAASAVEMLEYAAAEDPYVYPAYKQRKSKVLARDFSKRRPLQLQGSAVEFAEQHVQLGIMLDTRFDGRAHLHHILSRGSSRMLVLILELTMLGLPMHALLLSVRTRLIRAVAIGVELVVHIPYSDKQLNSMQASWMRKISGCNLVPRIVLLWELGFRDRLSAVALARAIMLRRRSRADPRHSREYETLAYAEREPSSWPAIVRAKEEVLAIPPFVVQASVQSSIRLKAQLWYHASTVVVPLVRAHEMRTWHESSKNCANWGNYSPMNWLSQLGPSTLDSQAWLQLKLQGYFTSGSRIALPACRLYGRDEAETVHHFFSSVMMPCNSLLVFQRGETSTLV